MGAEISASANFSIIFVSATGYQQNRSLRAETEGLASFVKIGLTAPWSDIILTSLYEVELPLVVGAKNGQKQDCR
jgi:hypothetical protein